MRTRLLVLAVTALTLLSACTGGGDSKYYRFTSKTELGTVIPVADRKPAKDFSGELLSGGKTSLAAAKGKVVVVNFWAAWCVPCRAETPQFDSVYRRLRGSGVDFLGVDTKDRRADAVAFVKNNDITYPIVYDKQGQTLLTLGNFQSALPFTVLVDASGRVAAVYLARLSAKDLSRSISMLLTEK